jgi:hypothetical protein
MMLVMVMMPMMPMMGMMRWLGKYGARAQHEHPYDHECGGEFVHKKIPLRSR